MRKYTPLVALLLAVFLIGCGGQVSPEPAPTEAPVEVVEPTDAPAAEIDPTDVPSPTTASEAPTDLPEGESEAAECVEADAEFPVQQGLSPVSADDQTKGASDASITVIEYSDFQ